MRNGLALFMLAYLVVILSFTSCEKIDELLESETDKTVRIFTHGGIWNVDSLVMKTDVLSGGVSNVTSDSTFLNLGTIEFQDPEAPKNGGYGSGYMIHRYTKQGKSRVDTLAWVPYNFQSVGQEKVITIFTVAPNRDPTGHLGLDMFLDLQIRQENKVKFSGWRRETISMGSGGSYGWYRSYVLTRK